MSNGTHQINIDQADKTNDGWRFAVTADGRQFKVSVTESYWRQLTGGRIEADQLVHKSFEFLLAREPVNSILSDFDLHTIQKYFPEYEQVIGEQSHDGRY